MAIAYPPITGAVILPTLRWPEGGVTERHAYLLAWPSPP
jgi:hypothetical protein